MIESLDDLKRLLELLDEHRVEEFRSGSLSVSKSSWPSKQAAGEGTLVSEREEQPPHASDDFLAELLYSSDVD